MFMARQFVKHQIGLVWNEESRRYIDDEPEFYIPHELRGRPVNAKQGSSGVLESSDLFI
ncbi:FAD-dependent thymidylate synthase, partial [Klebsiella pneumoniae]|nr:FAD-dependent thymidylate synthase [Klebsiella pneumoniae]